MSHEINQMVYAGAVPWHGLGKQLPANGTWADIKEASGFYQAEERPLFVSGQSAPIPDRKALVRADGTYLSTVGTSYRIIQFDQVAEALVKAANGVRGIFHTAGTLGPRGAKGWLLGELGDPIIVRGDKSEIRPYVLGVAGHDGVTAVTIKSVATRVVCANTLGTALSERDGEWRIYHAGNAQACLDEAAEGFRRMALTHKRLGEILNVLASTPFSDDQMGLTIDEVLPVPDDQRDHTRLMSDRERVRRLFHEAIGVADNGEIASTAYASVQAWSQWADHHMRSRATPYQSRESARLESIWMGRAASIKQRSLAAITRAAGIPVAA